MYGGFIPPIVPKKRGSSSGSSTSSFVPSDWQDPSKAPKGIQFMNGIYYAFDAGSTKNMILFSADDVIHIKELVFFLIWRYQKTYTRDYYEGLYGKMFIAFQEFLDGKRHSLEGLPGMFSGVLLGDKQYKYKLSFFVSHNVPMPMKGAKLAAGIVVDRVQNPAGMQIKNPQDIANAYKEIKTIFAQELDYMAKNPAFEKKDSPK